MPIKELRTTLTQVLRRVEEGERFTVTIAGRPVGQLVPLPRRRTVPLDEALRLAAQYAKGVQCHGANARGDGPRRSTTDELCEP